MEFEKSTRVQASPDQVFAFVSDVRNLPKYLPTTKSAQPQEGERVQLQGEANGHRYEGDGRFKQDQAGKRLEWGSDFEFDYSGWLEVKPDGDGASQVTVHLHFGPSPQQSANVPVPGEGPDEGQIQEGLDKALQSIQNQVEGKGGKEEPSAAS